MRYLRPSLAILLFPTLAFGQDQTFEVFGTIRGEYNSKVYFFYDGNYKQKDSISAEIKDGKFYFKASAHLPIQARFHLDQQSYIQDVYIDSKATYLDCSNKINLYGNDNDTMNLFSITNVNGSESEILKRNFENQLSSLKASDKTEQQKNQEYYDELYSFVSDHPKNKVSAYLLSKASSLRYSQVENLYNLIDTSLNKTFEAKEIFKLLNQLDKSKNQAIGVAFHDFILKDSNGVDVDTKDFRGKYTLIVCWASWCKPCRAEHPDLNMLYKKYKDKKFKMIGLSFDKDKGKWKQAIVKDKLYWTQVIDLDAFDGKTAKYYDIEAIPTNFLLDKKGKIIGVGLTDKEIEATIKSFFN